MVLYTQEIDDTRLPILEGGRMFSHMLVLDHATLFAESFAELVSGLIPGYSEADNQDELRAEFCAKVAPQIQESELERVRDNGDFYDLEYTAEELDALTAERFTFDDPVTFETWNHDVRLVLIAQNFTPFTDVALPVGDTLIIDGSTDESVIVSLHNAGVAECLLSNSTWA